MTSDHSFGEVAFFAVSLLMAASLFADDLAHFSHVVLTLAEATLAP